MYQILRRASLKHVLPRIVICGILAIALLAVSGSGLIRMLSSPTSLSDVTDMDGSYVRVDASEVIVAFATLTRTSSDDSTTTLKTYYLLPIGDDQYMAVMDSKEKNASLLDRAMEQSEEYYMGDLETLTKLGDISGTIRPLDNNMTGYMADVIDSYELPGYEEGTDSSSLIVPYQLNLDYAGFLKRPAVIAMGILALVLIVLLAVQLVFVFSGFYQRKVRRVVGGDVDLEDFQNAVLIGRVRVGKFVWYSKGAESRALRTEDLVWGYALSEPLVVSKYRWPVALYDKEQQETTLQFLDQKDCKAFLNAIAAQGHPFLMDYSSQRAALFQEDFSAFLQEAKEAAAARNSQEPETNPKTNPADTMKI